jgi:glycosyltransferase involved in cell wall biosynthesis
VRIGINTLDMLPGFGGGEEIFIRKVLECISGLESSAEFVVITDPLNHESFAAFERVQIGAAKQINRVAADERLDMVFTSYKNAPHKLSVPMVLLVMDLYELEVNSKRKKFWGGGSVQRNMGEVCEQASIVLVPSEYLKRELLREFTVPLNKVVVAPMGVDRSFTTEQRCIVEQPYILVVGKVSPRKNLARFREAFERIQDDIPHSLVIVGQPGDGEPEHWGDRVFRIDRLGTTQLAGLYQHADFYVHPSLYEGSGVSVLEAFASGALVCASKVGGIAEFGGDTPLYFNPDSVDSIVGSMKRALDMDEEERARRIQGGRQHWVEMTWDNCSWKTLSAFRKAVTGG